jgi:predicted RNase H-like nuclease (RuvC/YqgF family)
MSNHEDSNAEMYRRQILQLSETISMLEKNVHDLQGQLQNSYKRIEELNYQMRFRYKQTS